MLYWAARYYYILKMFRNSVALEKDHEQVNFIKMRIQGIWDWLDQDQEVGVKHINETKMFQMTSREPMEPIDEEAGVLGDLQDTADQTEEDKGDNPEHSASPVQPVVPDLLLD